jgi:hypothetical protein
MEIAELLNDKGLKAKAKVQTLSDWLLDNKISTNELLEYAASAKGAVKANCVEALEFATKHDPTIADEKCFDFVSKTLAAEEPRVKWESAKVIGNVAHLFSKKLDEAIVNLLTNSEHPGTVVRWSAAFALGEIIKLKTKHNNELLPAIETIIKREEQNSIRKIYLEAIKKTKN